MATKIYQYICDGDVGKFVLFHNEQSQMLKISILDTKKVYITSICMYVCTSI